MSDKNHNLQDRYLNSLRKDKTPVVVHLTNGTRLRGVIKGFDNFVVCIKNEKQQFIYKHAVSTIVPERDVNLRQENLTGE